MTKKQMARELAVREVIKLSRDIVEYIMYGTKGWMEYTEEEVREEYEMSFGKPQTETMVAYVSPDKADDINEVERKTINELKEYHGAKIMTLNEFECAFNHEEISDLGYIQIFDKETNNGE